ncbi:hypothetical protein FWJ25_03060 [Marinobacter salinexigens]|uniref:Uncharacterized protein n=1 Tax=Marinobacter salinexigens TaxID=2919747 RepID=A0A5B0VNC4_9GAMM|nr:hypothetical protein [Marinobacter salinexigens]KAA1176126.1 hypothetical protein FWJ25_03060 [Marinobacter salinexigens]
MKLNSQMHGYQTKTPALQRLSTRYRRTLWVKARRLAVLLTNTCLRSLVHTAVKPEFLFAVYGNEKQVGSYFTPWMANRLPPTVILGYIRNGDTKGLLVAPHFFEHELQEDPEKVRRYMDQLRLDYPGVKRIALVGRLPNFVKKAGIDIAAPLVDGSLGTRYMIWDVARQMRERPEFQGANSIVVLGGAGRIGNAVCEDLTTLYDKVIGLDPRYTVDEEVVTDHGMILRTSNLEHLHDKKLYIALTHHGDVVLDFYQHISPGALIADDTHPCITLDARKRLQSRQISVEKVVLSHAEFSMRPRMPDWNSRDIPGCLVEALVLLQQPGLENSQFSSFCGKAASLGFTGRLIRPLEE